MQSKRVLLNALKCKLPGGFIGEEKGVGKGGFGGGKKLFISISFFECGVELMF